MFFFYVCYEKLTNKNKCSGASLGYQGRFIFDSVWYTAASFVSFLRASGFQGGGDHTILKNIDKHAET